MVAGSRLLNRVSGRLGLDKAVVFALLTRAWQAAAGGISLLLISIFLEPEVQGYYYAFSSLVALQSFVELGMYIIVMILASHHWNKLSISASGEVSGDSAAISRLASLMRFVAKWYSGVGFLFVLGVGLAGQMFFSNSQATFVAWQSPWWAVVALAALQLWLMPILSLLEGCDQVVAINHFRLVQTMTEAATMWFLLVAGAGLWIAVSSMAVKVFAVLLLLVVKYRRFFQSLLASTGRERICWKQEVWPMQWRLAAQGIVNYFVYSLFTPIMFHFHGASVAGQMGMTLQIIGVIQMMASAWVQTKVPRFGILIANRQYAELDRIWWQASRLSMGFTVVGSLMIWMGLLILDELEVWFASRILGPLPTAIFLIAYGLMQIASCHAAYLRAHAREPFVVLGVMSGVLIGSLVFLFGSGYGPTGAALSLMMVVGLFVVPMSTMIWIRRRAEWQVESKTTPTSELST